MHHIRFITGTTIILHSDYYWFIRNNFKIGWIQAILAMTFSLPTETVKWIMIGIGAVSALGIFVFNTPGRNPLINIGAGLWDTYGMTTGLLGDVLSYIRLYALGLAGGMLGAAFNQLGAQVLGTNPNVEISKVVFYISFPINIIKPMDKNELCLGNI